MLEAQGRIILQIIGKPVNGQPGILQAADMSVALMALQTAIAQEETARSAAQTQAAAKGEEPPEHEGVSLRQRATPFIDMLRLCEQSGKDIVWGV